MKELLDFVLDRKEESLATALVVGIFLMSFGIYFIGTKTVPFVGSRLIITGSALFYISVVLLVFVIE
ncbi:MAG: hypothetical protein ABEJ72_11190 [Candidatus Aenigmatarchaeota archaeon]